MPGLTDSDLTSQATRVLITDEILRLSPLGMDSWEWRTWDHLFVAARIAYQHYSGFQTAILDNWIKSTAVGQILHPTTEDMRRMEECEEHKPGGSDSAFYRRWRQIVDFADQIITSAPASTVSSIAAHIASHPPMTPPLLSTTADNTAPPPIKKDVEIEAPSSDSTRALQRATNRSEEPLNQPVSDSGSNKTVVQQPASQQNTKSSYDASMPTSRLAPTSNGYNIIRLTGRRIFISYSSKDKKWCDAFAVSLEEAGADVWYDSSLHGGAEWIAAIERELESRELFLVILTQLAWESVWVQREIHLAFATNRTIVPVLLAPTTVTGFMRTIQHVDVKGKEGDAAAQTVGLHLFTLETK